MKKYIQTRSCVGQHKLHMGAEQLGDFILPLLFVSFAVSSSFHRTPNMIKYKAGLEDFEFCLIFYRKWSASGGRPYGGNPITNDELVAGIIFAGNACIAVWYSYIFCLSG